MLGEGQREGVGRRRSALGHCVMDDLHEIFSGCQWMAKVPNAVEILPKI